MDIRAERCHPPVRSGSAVAPAPHGTAMRSVVLLAAAMALLAADRPAEACSCQPAPPVCEAFWAAGAVFSGTVTSVASGPSGAIEATFAVDETFRGGLSRTTVVVNGGGVCGTVFEAGKPYLVYADDRNGQWHSSLCSRTAPLADASADVAYAHAIPERTFATVEGTVSVEGETGELSNRAGVVVRAQGTKLTARTDRTGHYQLQLPAGTYTLAVDDPGTRIRWGEAPSVALPRAAACARRDIIESWNGRIQGKLTEPGGAPAANIELSAYEVSGRQRWRLSARSDAGGRYEIPAGSPGTYVVAVGGPDDGGPDARQPIATTYYPGVPTRTKARLIKMTRAGLVTRIDFQLPAPLAVYTISGVLRQNGQPLAGTLVKISNELLNRGASARTDATGRFEFRDIAGAEVTLEVCRPDVDADHHQTACRQTRRRLDADVVVDLDLP